MGFRVSGLGQGREDKDIPQESYQVSGKALQNYC